MQPARLAHFALVPFVVLLGAGSAYELANALRGTAAGEGWIPGIAALAALLGGFACFALASRAPALGLLVAPLAGALALAHYWSYDSYCGSYGCRVADETPTAWKGPALAAVAGLLAGAITVRRPRPGMRATGVVAVFSALTVFFLPFGH